MTKIKRVRHYVKKQPEVGDSIVIVDANMFGRNTNGQEMIITNASTFSGTTVFAYSSRHGKVVAVGDSEYRIYSDVIYGMIGVDIIEKKFFGITYRTDEIEKWEEAR